MLTYCNIKRIMEDGCDYADLFGGLLFTLLTIFLDLILIIFQPILYLIVKAFEKENYEEEGSNNES